MRLITAMIRDIEPDRPTVMTDGVMTTTHRTDIRMPVMDTTATMSATASTSIISAKDFEEDTTTDITAAAGTVGIREENTAF